MDGKYAFEWLDLAVTTILNPLKTNIAALDAGELEGIQSQIQREIIQSKTLLSKAAFRLFGRRKIQRMVSQYQKSLFLLLDTAFERERQSPLSNEKAAKLSQSAREAIQELLDFIEHRFGEYIDLDCPVPALRLTDVRKTMAARINALRPWLESVSADPAVANIILEELSSLSGESIKHKLSFRQVFYQKQLLDHLEGLAAKKSDSLDELVELLIFMNFNSRAFLDYYTSQLSGRIEGLASQAEQYNHLLLARKAFAQRHHQSEYSLNHTYPSVKTLVGRWFDAELNYLESQRRWGIRETSHASQPEAADPAKILCILSIDQIALIFRALDSLRIIEAKSLNSVFQQIAPYLSTPRKRDISWESMRSKAYQFEASDKERVLKMLDSVTRWIHEYEMR